MRKPIHLRTRNAHHAPLWVRLYGHPYENPWAAMIVGDDVPPSGPSALSGLLFFGATPETCAGGQDAPGSVEPGEVTTWTTCGTCRVRPQTPVPCSRSPARGGTQIGPWPQAPFKRHHPACPPAPRVRSSDVLEADLP